MNFGIFSLSDPSKDRAKKAQTPKSPKPRDSDELIAEQRDTLDSLSLSEFSELSKKHDDTLGFMSLMTHPPEKRG